MKLEDAERILRKHKKELNEKFGVKSIAIFGSTARGESGNESDVDIIVELSRPLGFKFVNLVYYLQEILGTSVDVITKKAAKNKVNFWKSVEKESKYV